MGEYWHITWSTHNSRISQRMRYYHIKHGESLCLGEQQEVIITEIIAGIVKEKSCRIYAYNICKDHIHMIIECLRDDISNSVRLIKGKSAQRYKEHLNIDSQVKFNLWSQKFNKWLIKSDEQFNNTVMYIIRNRNKHGLSESRELHSTVLEIIRACGDMNYYEEYEKMLRATVSQNKGLQPLVL